MGNLSNNGGQVMAAWIRVEPEEVVRKGEMLDDRERQQDLLLVLVGAVRGRGVKNDSTGFDLSSWKD